MCCGAVSSRDSLFIVHELVLVPTLVFLRGRGRGLKTKASRPRGEQSPLLSVMRTRRQTGVVPCLQAAPKRGRGQSPTMPAPLLAVSALAALIVRGLVSPAAAPRLVVCVVVSVCPLAAASPTSR